MGSSSDGVVLVFGPEGLTRQKRRRAVQLAAGS